PIRMITVGSEAAAIALARELLDEGFYTSVTFFPTVAQGKAGIRVCLTADHDVSDIERLCRCIIARKPEVAREPEAVPALA
ncbi:MAG: 7-keto-8-aminopelargonate synthetase, partial [Bradyrhizobium sp.]